MMRTVPIAESLTVEFKSDRPLSDGGLAGGERTLLSGHNLPFPWPPEEVDLDKLTELHDPGSGRQAQA